MKERKPLEAYTKKWNRVTHSTGQSQIQGHPRVTGWRNLLVRRQSQLGKEVDLGRGREFEQFL